MTVKGVLKGSGVVSVLVKQTPFEGRDHPSQNSKYKNALKVHKTNSAPFFNCPRYTKCNVNDCPLDPVYPNGFVHSDDIEQKCTLPKSYRVKVAAEFPGVLKFGGLKHKEFAAKSAWESKSDDERAECILALKKSGFPSASEKEVHVTDVIGCTDDSTTGKRAKPDRFYDDRDNHESKYEFWGCGE